MKVRLKIDGRWFEVEVGDLGARPILAEVEGRRFEVWPESRPGPALDRPPAASIDQAAPAPRPEAAPPRVPAAGLARTIRAPIPGVILSVAVAAGDQITPGQELCLLEAMKMRNPIRSPRAGSIARVAITAGQVVRHHETLFEFTD
jgi:biotin carboxyl carrier protein